MRTHPNATVLLLKLELSRRNLEPANFLSMLGILQALHPERNQIRLSSLDRLCKCRSIVNMRRQLLFLNEPGHPRNGYESRMVEKNAGKRQAHLSTARASIAA